MGNRPAWMLALALVAAGCDSDEGQDTKGFMDECSSSDQCPDDWTCPSFGISGWGDVARICVPFCDTDGDCEVTLLRTDVSCLNGICTLDCYEHSDCPDTQPFCRGSDDSCAPYLDPPFFCSTEDMSC